MEIVCIEHPNKERDQRGKNPLIYMNKAVGCGSKPQYLPLFAIHDNSSGIFWIIPGIQAGALWQDIFL
jgi:hypothetical protein